MSGTSVDEALAEALGRPIVIVGAGGHGRVALDVLNAMRAAAGADADSTDAIAAATAGAASVVFLDDGQTDSVVQGVSVAGSLAWGLDHYRAGEASWFVAIGDNAARRRVSAMVRERGHQLVTLVHPSAIIATDVRIGRGAILCAGTIVGTGARIDDDVVMNTASSIDHDVHVARGAFLGPGVIAAGGVTIGSWAFIGVGTSLAPSVRVGDGAVVGAGSLVLDDVPGGVVAFGVPAMPRRPAGG